MTEGAVTEVSDTDIAVIGIGLRFPGAEDVKGFWNNLKDGVESIHWFDEAEMVATNPKYREDPGFVRAGAVLQNVELFDADFFGYTRREAEMIDPQHRIFLECAWEAFEDAGYAPLRFTGAVGVYAGCALNTYLINNVHPSRGYFPNRTFMESAYDYQLLIASEADHLTSRVSYKLNLRGPSINLQAACATSLVSVHLACQALLMCECEMALAGGSTIRVPHASGYLAEDGMVFSPDGHTRTFDRNARGTVFGSGAAAVLLKPLCKALADRDAIYAVIKGTAVNNDGSAKLGFTAPSVEGQVSVIRQALANAAVQPESISYVEAHGTGTALGDPIEIAALTQAFASDKKGFCALGSVKTNIGHVGRSAGMAGLVKTALALKNRQLPPSLHFETSNPQITFADTPFYVNTQLKEWTGTQTPRRAGVSAFGMGGTNAHVVLEEVPEVATSTRHLRPWHVLALSARNEIALKQLVERYIKFLETNPNVSLPDICHTANLGREHFHTRFSAVVSSVPMLLEKLRAVQHSDVGELKEVPSGEMKQTGKVIAFLFSGQGVQYDNMTWQLYETQPAFRRILDQCDELLSRHWQESLLDILNPRGGSNELIHDAAYTQGALFCIEYALAQLWMSWGVNPAFLMGHSVGEYAAAATAGVFSLEDGLRFVAERGRLFKSLIPVHGRMVAVGAGEERVRRWLKPYAPKIGIAAVNGPENTVISGDGDAVAALCTDLKAQRVSIKSLSISRACHSVLTEPVLPELYEVAKQICFSPPRIPLVSNVTGTLVGADLTTPEYWCRHAREAVRFEDGMQTLAREHANAFIEIGPDAVLLGMGAACLPNEGLVWLPSVRRRAATGETHDEWQCLASSVATAYREGCRVNWEAFDAEYSFQRVHLPTYPFQRSRYWIEPNMHSAEPTLQIQSPVTVLTDGYEVPVEDWKNWLLKVKWIRQDLPSSDAMGSRNSGDPGHWLVLSDRGGVGNAVAEQLRSYGKFCTKIDYTSSAEDVAGGKFNDEFAQFWGLQSEQSYGLIYLCGLDAPSAEQFGFNSNVSDVVWESCAGLVAFVQAASARSALPRRICVVTCAAQAVLEGDTMNGVFQTPLWPLTKVIAMEYSDVACTRIDFTHRFDLNDTNKLVRELLEVCGEDAIAHRGTQRYVARLTRAECAPDLQGRFASDGKLHLSHPEGAFLIIGGLGELGLQVAQWLARRGVRRLVLVGRNSPGAEAAALVTNLRRQGVEVMVAQADVAQFTDIQAVLERLDALGYPLVGLVHAATGTLEDGVMTQQTRDRFLKAFSSKVQGAWNLHRLIESRTQKPDHVVLFSSVASLLGNAGQANYAAANGFLEGLSHYRCARGQACVAVNWGVWATPLTLRRLDVHFERLKQRGFKPIAIQEGLASLRAVFVESAGQIGVVPMEWSRYLAENDLVNAPFYAALLRPAALSAKPAMTLSERIAGASVNQRHELIRACVRDHVIHIAGFNPQDVEHDAINDDRSLTDYGIDSLAAIELKNRIQKSVGHVLPLSLAFDYPSVASITDYVHRLFLIDK